METNSRVEKLFEQYADMVYRTALSYGKDPHLAEDVVQEVFLRLIKKNPQLESPAHEKAWLIRVAVNRCKSLLVSGWRKRIRPLDEAPEHAIPFEREEEHQMYEMLLQLPPKYRIVLYLRYYEQYQVKEIAGLLHLTPNAVSARLSRAKKMMKLELTEDFQRKEMCHENI